MEDQRLRIVVRGRVQGVFYRASTQKEALRIGLCGWVRNLPDGSVEIVAEGGEESLAALERWCRKGPPAAIVQSLDRWDEPASGEFERFDIHH